MDLRKLDALIAERVMGCKVDIKTVSGRKEYYCGCADLKHEHSNEDPYLNYYSTDISAAWEVVEKSKMFNSPSKLLWFHEEEGNWCMSEMDGYDSLDFICKGDTVPHAICLAALKAMNIDVSEWEK